MRSSGSILNQVTSDRWFALGLLLAGGLLLSLVAMTFDDDSLPLPALYEKPEPVDRIIPVKDIEHISSNLTKPAAPHLVNGNHPFFTAYFKPAPPPPTPPVEPVPPPAPVLKKVPLLYQGVYQTADGREQAFLKVENKLAVLGAGGSVIKDWTIAEISKQKLTLTNRAAETTILEFNREKILEVQP